MYIPSKPDKYGLKIVMLNDAMTSYLVSTFIDNTFRYKIYE